MVFCRLRTPFSKLLNKHYALEVKLKGIGMCTANSAKSESKSNEYQTSENKELDLKVSDTQKSGKCVSEQSPSEDDNIAPVLDVLTNGKNSVVEPSALKTVSVVPGKGPPPEPPVTCCMSGCANCVWIAYAEELKNYYSDGGEKAKEALEQIEDPSLKAFIKLELGLR